MDPVEITVSLPQQTAESAQALGILNNDEILRLIREEIERREEVAETQWEQSLASRSFANAFREDGSVDFDLLASQSTVISPDDLDPDQ